MPEELRLDDDAQIDSLPKLCGADGGLTDDDDAAAETAVDGNPVLQKVKATAPQKIIQRHLRAQRWWTTF